MIKRSQYVGVERSTPNQKDQNTKKPGDDCSAGLGSGTEKQCSRDLPAREHSSKPILPMAAEVQGGRDRGTPCHEARSKDRGLRKSSATERSHAPNTGTLRDFNRVDLAEKKRELKQQTLAKRKAINLAKEVDPIT